jgi:oxygen-independent coproporphyrinogen-3 oxidase
MVNALAKELIMRREEGGGEAVGTIYFGGGTPSVLTAGEVALLLETVYEHYPVVKSPEITLEANPDDLVEGQLKSFSDAGINRLSIGIQSFHDRDLQLMNRAHNAREAETCLQLATQYFENISIDLIYGIPGASLTDWLTNLQKTLGFGIPHISAYALTVEPRTALKKFIDKGLVAAPDEEAAAGQFYEMINLLEENGFVQYELSNFGRQGYFSENNSAYWKGKSYLGIGPSAHSYDGKQRSWNVRSNPKYLKAIQNDALPSESEMLTKRDRYNEYVMTGLRTIWGVSFERVRTEFGLKYYEYLLMQANRYLEQGLLETGDGNLLVAKKGKFLSDGIASDLFMINLK